MTEEAQEWLLGFVQFYRNLEFFEEYSELSDEDLASWLIQTLTQQRIDLNYEGARSDYLVLDCDRRRVWGTAFDSYDFYKYTGSCYGWRLHEDIVNGWTGISKGLFLPEDVKAKWQSIQEPIQVEFFWSGVPYTFCLEPDLIPGASYYYCDSTLTKLADAINPLIVDTGYRFTIWDLGCAAIVMLLTSEERRVIEERRGAKFL